MTMKVTKREIVTGSTHTFRQRNVLQLQFFNRGNTMFYVMGIPVYPQGAVALGNANYPEDFQIDVVGETNIDIQGGDFRDLIIVWEETQG